MKKTIFIFTLIILSCSLFNGLPEQGIYYTASTVFSFQQFGLSKEFANVSMVYVYPIDPNYKDIVLKRMDEKGNLEKIVDTVKVDNPQYLDDQDTLLPDTKYLYSINFIKGREHPYDTLSARTLPVIEMVTPVDTVRDSTITIQWKTIERLNERFTDYTVEIYKGMFDMENPDLPQKIFFQDVIVNEDDQYGTVEVQWNNDWSDTYIFTIKISTKKELQYLTDNSITYKSIVWLKEQ